jgi:hypothetical protein
MNWVQKFRTTASATNKKPEGRVRTERTQEKIERARAAIGRSPKRSARIQVPSTYRADRSDGYFILVYFFAPTNYTLCEKCQTVILLQEVHFVSNLLPW